MNPTPPDPYDLANLHKRLQSLALGSPFEYFPSIESTNTHLKNLPPEDVAHGFLALTDHQAAGRGKYRRRWVDAPGKALLFSVLLLVERPPAAWPLLTLGAGLAVQRALTKHGLEGVEIRWPNDVLIGGRKVCGILTETGPVPSSLVVGIGLNVHQAAGEFPPEIGETATSLFAVSGRRFPRVDLLVSILEEFGIILELWMQGGDRAITEACEERLWARDRTTTVTSSRGELQATVLGLETDGSLVVRTEDGSVQKLR
jgi:BirA family biotin operon repressor/biotin-[acetyl-CoA-carboxylase] ligase